MLPAAVVSVSALQPGPVDSIHPRPCSTDGGEAESSGAESTRDRRRAAGCAGGYPGPGDSGRHG